MPGPEPHASHQPLPAASGAGVVPVSVWLTGQRWATGQRRGRYLPESTQHPARMLPAIAGHAITTYTQPGELVLDPMCGIGTTLVEASHHHRHSIGIEYEPRWADLATANLHLATTQGATGGGTVIRGDATNLPHLVPDNLHGKVALVLTSPPYGPTVHGHVRPGPDGVHKTAHRYSDNRDRHNLAHRGWHGLLDGFTTILSGCTTLLRPGGTVVVTARPWRRNGQLVDLPSAVLAAGAAAGLQPVERCVALLAALRGGRLIARPSFFQLQQVRRARQAGIPMHLIAHEDVLVLRRPLMSRSSAEPKCSQCNVKGCPCPSSRLSHRARREAEGLM